MGSEGKSDESNQGLWGTVEFGYPFHVPVGLSGPSNTNVKKRKRQEGESNVTRKKHKGVLEEVNMNVISDTSAEKRFGEKKLTEEKDSAYTEGR